MDQEITLKGKLKSNYKKAGVSAAEVAEVIGLTEEQFERVYADILNKRKATHALHMEPVLIEEVKEIKM